MDLAGKNDEIRFGKSLGFPEALRDAAQLERRHSPAQKFPRGTASVPARIFASAAFVSSTTEGGTLASAAGFHTNEITPLERP